MDRRHRGDGGTTLNHRVHTAPPGRWRATATAFTAAGYHIIVTDILEAEGKATAEKIAQAGGSAEFHHLDVTSTEDADRVAEAVLAAHGPPDCIVANAGIAHRVPLAEMTDEKWDHTFEVDLKGIMRVVRPLAPAMRARGHGAIVCISSISGLCYGWDEHVQYNAAKAGVLGLVRGLAIELAKDGIRVMGIAPGLIRTAQSLSVEHSLGPEGIAAAAGRIPLGRVGEPEGIADVVVFLASDKARYMTGQTILVDGGLTVWQH